MIINYDGQQYPFDMDDITVQQALKIEKYMDCSFAEWGKRLQPGEDPEKPRGLDLKAVQVLGWLILHPDGGVAIEDTDFKLARLDEALAAAFKAEEAPGAEAEPVPTDAVSNGHLTAASSPASLQPFSAAI